MGEGECCAKGWACWGEWGWISESFDRGSGDLLFQIFISFFWIGRLGGEQMQPVRLDLWWERIIYRVSETVEAEGMWPAIEELDPRRKHNTSAQIVIHIEVVCKSHLLFAKVVLASSNGLGLTLVSRIAEAYVPGPTYISLILPSKLPALFQRLRTRF